MLLMIMSKLSSLNILSFAAVLEKRAAGPLTIEDSQQRNRVMWLQFYYCFMMLMQCGEKLALQDWLSKTTTIPQISLV